MTYCAVVRSRFWDSCELAFRDKLGEGFMTDPSIIRQSSGQHFSITLCSSISICWWLRVYLEKVGKKRGEKGTKRKERIPIFTDLSARIICQKCRRIQCWKLLGCLKPDFLDYMLHYLIEPISTFRLISSPLIEVGGVFREGGNLRKEERREGMMRGREKERRGEKGRWGGGRKRGDVDVYTGLLTRIMGQKYKDCSSAERFREWC